ncbi:nuclear transport factor 2 family protein [Actinosynnema sp. NPDC020468]|uniref:nuclear transport factor 2 family protein n=1 Tax=Actinosynnema sp. NPDC020468 TaxID=3154488 RepID=UPI0034055689
MGCEDGVRAAVRRYCRGVDRMDETLLRQAFHPDARIRMGDAVDGGVDDLVAFLWRFLPRRAMTMHYACDVLVEPVGPTAARAETYGFAVQRGPDLVTGFRYLDHLVAHEGRWVITDRTTTTEWVSTDHPAPLPPGVPTGIRTHPTEGTR